MPDTGLEQFHFLRPVWLLVIPLAIWLHLRLRRNFSAALMWKSVIAPHLLESLTVGGKGAKRLRPYQLMTAALVLASIALAGPTWQREITPFTEDRAPLVVALELTPTMLGADQPPSRLERAKQKLRDLLERRKGARTSVVGYAGSAHAVLPLTDDAGLIEVYLESLTPDLMPREGDDATTALALAQSMLAREDAIGTILFMTDGIDRTHAPRFAEHADAHEDQLLFLAFGTTAGGPVVQSGNSAASFGLVDGKAPGVDMAGINAVAAAAGGSASRATPDVADIDALSRQIRSHLVNTIQQDENLQWRDFGYVLVWPLAFILLLWSRRGWTVNWV
ncbi:MAG: VWA domain-containing protein [Hyphomicrobiaceae bacterium]|nr:VWA domain-containing protein [Hyphomicrobiaceae bacterium]